MLRVQFQQECKFVPTQWVVVWLGQNHHTNCPPHQLKVATSALGTSLHTAFATHSIQLAIGNPYSSRNLQQCLLKRALLNPAKHFNFDFRPMATSSSSHLWVTKENDLYKIARTQETQATTRLSKQPDVHSWDQFATQQDTQYKV